MDQEERKSKIRSDLANVVKKDIKDAKIEKKVQSLDYIDGKIKACFIIEGLAKPGKSDEPVSWRENHREIDKIFNSWTEFATYAEEFFKTDVTNLT